MKKVLILIAIIALPLITVGQTTSSDTGKQNDSITVRTIEALQTETKTVLSTTAKAEVNYLSYKKSNELISIKAYRKSLSIKVKEIKNC